MGSKVGSAFASGGLNVMGAKATGIGKEGRAALDASGQDGPSGSPRLF